MEDATTIIVAKRLPVRFEMGSIVKENKFDEVLANLALSVDSNSFWVGHLDEAEEHSDNFASSKSFPVTISTSDYDKYTAFCDTISSVLRLNLNFNFKSDDWKAYVSANRVYGKRTVDFLKTQSNNKDNLVWIHDYHLLLAAIPIREAILDDVVNCKLGFFLHAQFPPWEIFVALPCADELVQGMLACDVISFQTINYCENFLKCCYHLGFHIDAERLSIEHGSRTVCLKPFIVGIPFEHFARLAGTVSEEDLSHEQKTIVIVDECQSTSIAFQMLLENYTEHCNSTELQILSLLCDESKKKLGLVANILRNANVFVSDNILKAKQFVACQINRVPGVLLLSKLTEAVELMPEALTYNPHDAESFSKTLHRALIMPDNEKAIRMNFLKRREEENDSVNWSKRFLGVLQRDQCECNIAADPDIDYFEQYLAPYVTFTKGCTVAILLDYDGTLTPIMPHPNLAIIPEATKNILVRLSKIDRCHIAVISGRGVENVKKMVGVEGITYAGNHGLEILFPDGSKYSHHVPAEVYKGIEQLARTLEIELGEDGDWVEDKKTMLTFHFRESSLPRKTELEARARTLIEKAGFKAEQAHLAVEAKPLVRWNKGCAALYILERAYGTDWGNKVRVVWAGDDVTDEYAMQVLKGLAATFRITTSAMTKTSAERRIPSPKSILALLQWIEQYLNE
ncbi:hypothetical protein FQA39_LY15819 [Lamprigera yunnana]|nr:hypothetical protein FQA39_LY15819 [Lamprigera yunnana]